MAWTACLYFVVTFFFTLSVWSQEPPTGVKANKFIIKTQIDKSGKAIATTEIEFIVESEVGRTALTNYRVHFSGSKDNFRLLETYSDTMGQKSKVSPGSITVSEHQTLQEGLSDLKQVVIPISGVGIGSRVVISYQITTPAAISGHLSEVLALANDSLAKEEFYLYESDLPIKFISQGVTPYFSEKTYIQKNSKGEPEKYFLEFRPTEIGYATIGKNNETGIIYISTSPDWNSIREYFSSQYQKVWNDRLPQPLQDIVKKIAPLTTPQEQIEVASLELSKIIAYSGNWKSNEGKFIPQKFSSLIKSKMGDCKDYSSALVAILRQVGFEAFPALTFRSRQYLGMEYLEKLKEVPNIASFNHAIVWAKDKNNKVWWVDPTNPLVIAGTIASDILGNFSLILDGASQDVVFLPAENLMPNDTSIEYVIKLNPDNSVESNGKILLNEVSYNSIGLIEKAHGLDFVKNVINYIISPGAKLDMSLKKEAIEKVPRYDFQFVSKSLIYEETKKYKKFYLPHPALVQLHSIEANRASYVGEIGTFKVVTKIEKAQAVETYSEDCYTRTPWFEVDRVVENKEDYILVTDTIKTKQRTISKKQASDADFNEKLNSVHDCTRNMLITLSLDPSLKTEEQLKKEKDLGPDVYSMTEQDAKRIRELSKGAEYSFVGPKKLLKYYSLKLKQEPNNPEYLVRKAQAITDLGYLSGRKYDQAFLEDSISLIDKAYDLKQKKYDKLIYQNRISTHIKQKKYKLAGQDLKVMSESEKEDRFLVYSLSADLAYAQEAYELAEQWLRASEKIAKTQEEKESFYRSMSHVLTGQNKIAEAIKFSEELLKTDPNNAWKYHNVAILYNMQKDYDKVIEYEKKALAITEFGMAKRTLSEAYLAKAFALKPAPPLIDPRLPTSVGVQKIAMAAPVKFDKQSYETLLLESINADSENKECLIELITFYSTEMLQGTDWKTPSQKANIYLEQLRKVDAQHPLLGTLSSVLQMYTKVVEQRLPSKSN
ncbi:transglutaminase domain-containing protein [Pseudobdellovibrio exovorus]|uniref:Transglutaminase-like domain-containing protein n=1 Tax=Pseudobdellovibrio exovorus JSS TaxID=1184267 RepID=M4VCY2_9BACT|nr:transglutaminase domain-containing protein [Pseudobdellovibrio exovorus]AGH96345.1 hypothetical protein A11Q_2129 [Pseudobdellovibrio exovorus JSS]